MPTLRVSSIVDVAAADERALARPFPLSGCHRRHHEGGR